MAPPRKHVTQALLDLQDDALDQLRQRIRAGDPTALELWFRYAAPLPRKAPLATPLPPVPTGEDAMAGFWEAQRRARLSDAERDAEDRVYLERVFGAAASGQMAPEDATALAALKTATRDPVAAAGAPASLRIEVLPVQPDGDRNREIEARIPRRSPDAP